MIRSKPLIRMNDMRVDFFRITSQNIKSKTEFELLVLSEYLVGTWSIGKERNKLKESAIAKRSSLIEE